jgi:hypothetical protein
MTRKKLHKALFERLAIPKRDAGQALGWGKKTTEAVVANGDMPVIAGPNGKTTVPTWWIRRQLRLGDASPGPS